MGFIDVVAEILRPFLDRLADDSSFRSGFYWGLLVALAVGLLAKQVLYQWNKVLQFFKPTSKPETSSGPSPFKTWLKAIFAFAVLVAILLITLLIVIRAT